MATALTAAIDGAYTAPAVINVHFLSDGSGNGSPDFASFTDPNGNTFGTDGWTTYERQQAELAFQQFTAVADVTFNFVDDLALADFVMVTGSESEVGAPGYWNVGGGTITVDGTDYQVDGVGVFNWQAAYWDYSGVTGTMEIGGRGFLTLLQEIGRGLGLAHPHDTDGGSTVMAGVTAPTGDYGDFQLNQGVFTTMSLNDGWQTAPHGASTSDSWGWEAGPMALDIAVLQETYGANTAANPGDTVYDMTQSDAAGTFYQTIWDAGGTDTIRHSGLADAVIDLRPATLEYEAGGGGFLSYLDGIHGGFTIAHGVVIEDAVGGPGDDVLIGNAAGNVLTGGPGADHLSGGPGRDTASYVAAGPVTADLSDPGGNTGDAAGDSYLSIENLEGGSFADWLGGDSGANRLLGGGGDDVLHGGPGGDLLDGGSGSDTATYRHAAAAVTVELGDPADNQGEAAGDRYVSIEVVEGSSFEDRLIGSDAADVLLGGGGGDLMGGRDGADRISGQAGNDRLYGAAGDDFVTGDGGNDRLFGGFGNDLLGGGDGADHVYGEAGNDRLYGAAGEDVLIGGGGNDRLYGGDGADLLGGGDGADHVYGEAGNDRLYGAADDDVLIGGGGNDRLYGGDGADLLGGGDGADRVYGEAGDDRLYGAAGDDIVIGGGGNDRLYGGDGADLLGGGDGADRVYGEAGNDRLYGAAGDDVLIGGGGNDRLYGGDGADLLGGGGGDDLLLGNSGNDRLFGAAGNDQLVGGAGNDRLVGNEGADLFVFQPDGSHDVVADFEDDFDQLDFRAFDFASEDSVLDLASQAGADVVFGLPGGASVTLTDFDLGLLGAEDVVI